jgi:hypothetical protein
LEQPFVNHPLTDHLDMVTLVCYSFAILHSCVCALPLRVGLEPTHLGRHPAPIPAAVRANGRRPSWLAPAGRLPDGRWPISNTCDPAATRTDKIA